MKQVSNVIGFKGTPEERQVNWASMRMLRDYNVFKEPDELEIRNRYKRLFSKFLSKYMQAA